MFAYSKNKVPVTKLIGFKKEWRHYWNKVVLKRLLKRESKKDNNLRSITPAYDKAVDNYGVIEDMVSLLKYKDEAKLLFSTEDKPNCLDLALETKTINYDTKTIKTELTVEEIQHEIVIPRELQKEAWENLVEEIKKRKFE